MILRKVVSLCSSQQFSRQTPVTSASTGNAGWEKRCRLTVQVSLDAQAYRVNDYDANVQLRCTAELTVLSAQCTVYIGLEY